MEAPYSRQGAVGGRGGGVEVEEEEVLEIAEEEKVVQMELVDVKPSLE